MNRSGRSTMTQTERKRESRRVNEWKKTKSWILTDWLIRNTISNIRPHPHIVPVPTIHYDYHRLHTVLCCKTFTSISHAIERRKNKMEQLYTAFAMAIFVVLVVANTIFYFIRFSIILYSVSIFYFVCSSYFFPIRSLRIKQKSLLFFYSVVLFHNFFFRFWLL